MKMDNIMAVPTLHGSESWVGLPTQIYLNKVLSADMKLS